MHKIPAKWQMWMKTRSDNHSSAEHEKLFSSYYMFTIFSLSNLSDNIAIILETIKPVSHIGLGKLLDFCPTFLLFSCDKQLKKWRCHWVCSWTSMSAISQLILTRFWSNFKCKALGTSTTDSNCYCDICAGNICPCDVCPYLQYAISQLLLTQFGPNFKDRFHMCWWHLSISAMSRQGKGKVKERSRQGNGKVKARSRQAQG